MDKEVWEFLELAASDRSAEIHQRMEAVVRSKDPDFLVGLIATMQNAIKQNPGTHNYFNVYTNLVQRIACSPSPQLSNAVLGAASLFRQPISMHQMPDYYLRRVAAELAQHRSRHELVEAIQSLALTNADRVELSAVLLQEMVINGYEGDDDQLVASVWRRLTKMRHPLARLPLHLTTVERGSPAAGDSVVLMPADRVEPDEFHEDSTTGLDREVRCSFGHWCDESNGRIVGKKYVFEAPIPADRLLPTVAHLVGIALSEKAPRAAVVTPFVGFSTLHDALAWPGAYSHEERGRAYARAVAWSLMNSALGLPSEEGIDNAGDLAARCTWFLFSGEWFYDVAWDVGVAIVLPGNASVVLIAATDTD